LTIRDANDGCIVGHPHVAEGLQLTGSGISFVEVGDVYLRPTPNPTPSPTPIATINRPVPTITAIPRIERDFAAVVEATAAAGPAP
jgi:hypothetical protein